MKKPNTKRLAKILKALGHENRLALYLGIALNKESGFEAECSICNIVKAFRVSAPTISHHLKELANADLITTEKRGKFVVAKINEHTLDEVEQVLAIARST